jgi:2-polyprenyl-6-hydroxyphenyl methylase/3-demethylubiquinone-9 3-methyltransferase
MNTHAREIESGERFAFGENWRRFLAIVDDERIERARTSLESMLGSIKGQSFVDVGCGSGLFSLAAAQLGARVVSFDFDPQSVACTMELRRRFIPHADWRIEIGSALDREYLSRLGKFDIVYSWGVLHHTGNMWGAIEMVSTMVDTDGRFFLAIYNDEGARSHKWRRIKKVYNSLPRALRPIYVAAIAGPYEARAMVRGLLRHGVGPDQRGMDRWRDWVDWVGGYPFEFAKPENVFDFLRGRGFVLERFTTVQGWGCNQFVCRRSDQLPTTKASIG